jgi:hypothetical protein
MAKANAPWAASGTGRCGTAGVGTSPDHTALPDCHTWRARSTKWSIDGSLTHQPSWKRSWPEAGSTR